MRTGIFGGTFNPPHLGHKYLADQIKTIAGLDRIIIIPANVPPHKEAICLLKGEDRLEMCRRTFYEPHYQVSDIEINRVGPSYTVDTIKEIKALYPDDELFLIVGSDMLLCFHLWRKYEEILSMCRLCVMSRQNTVSVEKLLSYSRDVLKTDGIITANVKPYEVSSTEIKSRIKNGEDVSLLVQKDMLDYIKKKRFYL